MLKLTLNLLSFIILPTPTYFHSATASIQILRDAPPNHQQIPHFYQM